MFISRRLYADIISLMAPSAPKVDLGGRNFVAGEWLVETPLNRVSRRGVTTRLEPKAMEVLVYLAERAGAVVPKEELISAIWAETFVTDQVLTNAIWQLRQAFGRSKDAEFIQTIPKGGYRLVAPVTLPEPPAAEPVARAGLLPPMGRSWRRLSMRWAAIGGSVVVAAALLMIGLARRSSDMQSLPEPRPLKRRVMIAVLPFQNLSGDPQQEYFSNGMTEEMILQLGLLQPERVGVIARASAMTYQGSEKRVDQIGKELGVDYILEGSVRRQDRRVRVTAQLVDVSTQTQVWGHNYEQDWSDTLLVQTDIARAIAEQIRLQLTPAQRARLADARAVHPEAYELYLKGRYHGGFRSAADAQRTIEYFKQSTELDPSFAAAHAELAQAYVNRQSTHFAARPGEGYLEAKSAALRALELDPALAEAHVARGAVASEFEWDWLTAEREFQRALQLNPSSEDGHRRYAELLMCAGRLGAAVAQIEQARAVDPLSATTISRAAFTYFFARDYDRSIAESKKALAIDPGYFLPYGYLAWNYGQQGRYQEALQAAQKGVSLTDQLDTRLNLARAYIGVGEKARARQLLREVEGASGKGYFHLYYVAMVYAYLGDKDTALGYLEKSYERRERAMKIIKVDPRYDLLRGEPRFQELVRRMKFPN